MSAGIVEAHHCMQFGLAALVLFACQLRHKLVDCRHLVGVVGLIWTIPDIGNLLLLLLR